jgi:hypothetical protein
LNPPTCGDVGEWDRDGRNGWDKKGISVTNFEKSVDLSFFPDGVQIQHPLTGEAVRPSVIDTVAAANIIYTLLRQAPLEIEKKNGVLVPKTAMPRWTQVKLWGELFERLLNSGKLSGLREKFEDFVETKKSNLRTHFAKLHHEMLKAQHRRKD